MLPYKRSAPHPDALNLYGLDLSERDWDYTTWLALTTQFSPIKGLNRATTATTISNVHALLEIIYFY